MYFVISSSSLSPFSVFVVFINISLSVSFAIIWTNAIFVYCNDWTIDYSAESNTSYFPVPHTASLFHVIEHGFRAVPIRTVFQVENVIFNLFILLDVGDVAAFSFQKRN